MHAVLYYLMLISSIGPDDLELSIDNIMLGPRNKRICCRVGVMLRGDGEIAGLFESVHAAPRCLISS
jgi:hypothetical protein